MQFSREQYLDWMTFNAPGGRPLFCELFGPLIGLPEEWRAQGASESELDLTAFDWDYVERVPSGLVTWAVKTPPVTIQEDDEVLVQKDYLGRTTQLCKKTATIPLPLDFPVKTMDDWLAHKPKFEYADWRIDWDQVARAKAAQAEGALIVAGMPGAFDTVRELMGEEMGCIAYYEQPELIEDIMKTIGDTVEAVFSRVIGKLTIDQLSVHEDFAGRSGPMVGPTLIEQYFKPYYRRAWDMLRAHGARIFQQDTDGNVNSVINALLDCGLTCVYPMEPAAGMDIVQLRKKYGTRLMTVGGIDKHVLRQDKSAIRKELEYKLRPSLWQGGIVLGLDHRIPNGTPLENYRYYVDLGREILGIPPRGGKIGAWRRMAF
jgi:hypothetical protein